MMRLIYFIQDSLSRVQLTMRKRSPFVPCRKFEQHRSLLEVEYELDLQKNRSKKEIQVGSRFWSRQNIHEQNGYRYIGDKNCSHFSAGSEGGAQQAAGRSDDDSLDFFRRQRKSGEKMTWLSFAACLCQFVVVTAFLHV